MRSTSKILFHATELYQSFPVFGIVLSDLTYHIILSLVPAEIMVSEEERGA